MGSLKDVNREDDPGELLPIRGLGEEFGRSVRDRCLAKKLEALRAEDKELEAEERRITGELESDLVDTMVPEKIEGTSNPYIISGNDLSPKLEQAVRLWTIEGEEIKTIALRCGLDVSTLRYAINSPQGKAITAGVRGALDHKFQGLFTKVIDTVREGLEHPDPTIALASANLWLRHNKTTEIKVTLTAEDIVQRLIAGEEIPDV